MGQLLLRPAAAALRCAGPRPAADPHLRNVDRLAERREYGKHPVDHHHIAGREVQLDPHHVELDARLEQRPEVCQRRPEMLRQRSVADVPPRHILRKRQADIDNGLRLAVRLVERVAAYACQLHQLFLRETEAVRPVVGLVHGVPHLNAAAVCAHMVERDFPGALFQLVEREALEPVGIDVVVAEPQRMALRLDPLALQIIERVVDIRIIVFAAFPRERPPGIKRERRKIERL